MEKVFKFDSVCCGKEMIELENYSPAFNYERSEGCYCSVCGRLISCVEQQLDEDELESYNESYVEE